MAGRHAFVGRLDRGCEVCGHADRNAVHWSVAEEAEHRAESDTSSNARPDSADERAVWPESTE